MWPLLIIGGIVAAVTAIAGWQISTALGGIPFWVWAVGLGAVAYLFLRSDTGRKAKSLAGTATKVYITRRLARNPRKRGALCL